MPPSATPLVDPMYASTIPLIVAFDLTPAPEPPIATAITKLVAVAS